MISLLRISLHFNRALGKLGAFVARYPKWVIIITLVSTVLFALGSIKLSLRTDLERLYAPISSRANEEERIVDELFPMNRSNSFDYLREVRNGRFLFSVLKAKDNQTMLRKSIFTEMAALDEMARSLEVEWKGAKYTYADICAKREGKCFSNHALSYLDRIEEIEAKEINVKYPLEVDLNNLSINYTAAYFGGVKTDGTNNIVEAKAVVLFYFCDYANESLDEISFKWERKFKEHISRYQSSVIAISTIASSDYDQVSTNFVIQGLQYGTLAFSVLGIFCFLSSMTLDWVTSKPLLSLAGLLSPLLAAMGSLGLTAALGIKFASFNICVIFLIGGIGVDDMFIMVAAWRATNSEDSVVNRLSAAYRLAATPIAMSTLTTLIAFSAGIAVPIPVVRVFCIQGAIAVTLDFVYQITFFGGCMALDGYREEKKLHPFTFRPVTAVAEADQRSWLYQILCTDKQRAKRNDSPIWRTTCNNLSRWITTAPIIVAILIIFVFYLIGASFGITTLGEGLDYPDLFFYDSDAHACVNDLENYFTEYTYSIQLVFNHTLDYSDRQVQKKVFKSIRRFHRSQYIQKQELNWLQFYLFFLRYNYPHSATYNLSDPKGFINCLRNEFFNHSLGKDYRNDVKFHDDGEHIVASRFVLFAKGSTESSIQKKLVEEVRAIADSSSLSATVQSRWWLQVEILFLLQRLTIQSLGAAFAGIFLVLTLLCSSLSGAFVVTIAVMSIVFGIVGYLSHIGITLNPISVLCLTFCLGFSIDPCTHVSYAYQESEGSYRDKVRRTLSLVGFPVFQGSFSTMLVVLFFFFIRHLAATIFSTIIVLILVLSFIHAVFLVTLLHHFCDVAYRFLRKTKKQDGNQNGVASTPQLVSIISNNDMFRA